MKQFLLLITILLFTLPVFSQGEESFFGTWDQPVAKKEQIQSELKIFPNPCKGSAITLSHNNENIEEVTITNITGKEVLFKKFQFPQNKTQLVLQELPNGIYLIRVKSTNNKTIVKKLMVSRQ